MVKETSHGWMITWNGKRYPVTDKHLTSPKAFLAAIGCQLMLSMYNQSKPNPSRAVLYHNADEAGVTWPDARER